MTDVEFAEAMVHIAGAYRDARYRDESVLNTWIKYFGKFDKSVFMGVIDDWVLSEPRSPQISDLINKCYAAQKKVDAKKMIETSDSFLGTEDDIATHPFEEGWRVKDGKWIQV